MYEHFETLDPEKRRRVLDAAFREFGRYGYAKTSVEQVAHSAGIAKGMVFHYFGSKRGMYEYLFEHAGRFIRTYFGVLEEQMQGLDFVEQYRLATKIKLQAYTEDPYVFEFFTTVFFHPENLDISEKVRTVYEDTINFRNAMLRAMQASGDGGRFRAGLSPQTAKTYIAWILDGYTQSLIARLDGKPLADMDLIPFWDEVDAILDDMKTLFYSSNNP